MGKALAVGAFVLGLLLLAAAGFFGVVAIWTHGPDAARWGGTAAASGMAGFMLSLLGGVWASG